MSTPQTNDGIMTNDANPVDSSNTELSAQEQEALNSLMPQRTTKGTDAPKKADEPKEELKAEEDDEEWDGKTPLHKVPRFQRKLQELKLEKERNDKLEAELKELKSGKQPEDKVPEDKLENQEINYDAIKKAFENVPKYKFKENYEDPEGFFEDIATALIGRLVYIRESGEKTVNAQTQQNEQQINKILDEFETDEQKQEFIEYAQTYFETYGELEPVMGDHLTDALINYTRDMNAAQKAEVRSPDKVSKTIRNTPSKSKLPSRDYLRSKSMDDILADFMQ